MKSFMTKILSLLILSLGILTSRTEATKLVSCSSLDQDHLRLFFKDGDVEFNDKAPTADEIIQGHKFAPGDDRVVTYGAALDTKAVSLPSSWTIRSADDPAYGGAGLAPKACYRKTKMNGMSQQAWDQSAHDWSYGFTLQHEIFLKLPSPLKAGKTYSLVLDNKLNSDKSEVSLTFDVRTSLSEAIHVNLVGYDDQSGVKGADLYSFLGDGGYRDYSSFEGKPVYLLNTASGQSQVVGKVALGKKSATEAKGFNLTGGDVWHVDFTGFSSPGSFRLVVDGVGCSPDFKIERKIYHDPFEVGVRGYFYMRIGQDNLNMRPIPRRPLWIPRYSPADTKVIITTMQPFHPEWKTFTSGDTWDAPAKWAPYAKPGNPENLNAFGGLSDAWDWSRQPEHVSSIYDLLMPYILTKGLPSDDNLGIADSGNGIPDLLDDARYEVDFWLRLRDGEGYGSGLTEPTPDHVFYQAGTSAMSAWSCALNCAMMAEAFRISNHQDLAGYYALEAAKAYNYAGRSKDPLLDEVQNVGGTALRGRDFKMMAAAYLYRVTGETRYEDDMKKESVVTSASSEIDDTGTFSQIWGVAAYLTTERPVHYPELQAAMKAAVIREAREKEADLSKVRPSRRSTDDKTGYFQAIQNVQRTIIAHAVSTGPDRDFFRDALVLEADWGLGRNPDNMIQMTTATTALASKRSVENMFTQGRDDGTPGLDPGHTPYLNTDDWAAGMIMGRPSWMTAKCYPTSSQWPKASLYFNTRYVWTHSEFTPQQTMRGKMALYAYLYALGLGAS